MAKNITPRSDNFPQWYQDVITAGELADNAPTRGCMIIRPTAFALWEKMQATLDRMFKETGHSNAYFPMLIPESFIKQEASHVEGFSPELAVVTHAGGKDLEEPLVVRPTSETVIGHMYSKWINSYRDLPVLINQWANVMRWELRPRLFLRTSEFLWQEGHTAHETAEEAQEETLKMLEVYRVFLEDYCAIPVITGPKPIHEKFPGADYTYTLEAMMQDGKALQSGTSHNLGQNFAKAFDIKFLGRENNQQYAYTTSWGVSTRMIGGLIMVHGDDDGLIIPPKIAPMKLAFIPLIKNENDRSQLADGMEKINNILSDCLGKLEYKMDSREDLRPSDKFFYWVQRGVPLRLEYGVKDAAEGCVMAVRRDNREKIKIPIDKISEIVPKILDDIQTALMEKAKNFRAENTRQVSDYSEFSTIMKEQGGFIETYWDGDVKNAKEIQASTKATIRVILSEDTSKKCFFSGKQSKYKVIFSQSY